MARQIINASDTLPASRPKINENFEELYGRRLVRAGWDFATAAERDAAVLTDDDIGFVCRVASPLGFWRLVAVSPSVAWEQVGGGASAGPAPISLMAAAWVPRITTGAGIDGFETVTNSINMKEVTFSDRDTEHAQATFVWPEGASTCTARVYWRATDGEGFVRYRVRLRCYGDNQDIDQAFGTEQAVTGVMSAANRVLITDATSAITPSGSVAGGNLCQIELDRDNAIIDNLDGLARVLAVRLEFQP